MTLDPASTQSRFQPISIELSEEQEEALLREVLEELQPALEDHLKRQQRFAYWLKAYKTTPEHERKDFPWPGASNVVVPICAIGVDTIQSRLQRAVFGSAEMFECTIKSPAAEGMEKDVRDWADGYVRKFNRDALRDVFFDMPQYGDAFIKLVWEETKRTAHYYDATGNVLETEIPEFIGVRWHVVAPSDMVYPAGFDKWRDLPWFGHWIRYTWRELRRKEAEGFFHGIDRIKQSAKRRQDSFFRAQQESAGLSPTNSFRFYETIELWGEFEVPLAGQSQPGDTGAGAAVAPRSTQAGEAEAELAYQEVILTLVLEPKPMLLRAIYNPYFGRARHLIKFPFLHQSHEVAGKGVTDMVLQFQESASASHNQVIDAGTVANASLIVTTPEANFGQREEVYPGKHIVCENPRNDVQAVPMGSASSVLGSMEQKATYYAEKRSGVSSYNMGMESSVVGSRATATGTTALISEGNIRFWVSIDDMRTAIEDLMYLTIQQEQQFRPEGSPISDDRIVTWPQADIRSSLGLRLSVTSEQINRDLEIQNLQMLMQVLNEYYARLMQAGAMIINPAFPPQQKMLAIQVMNASMTIIKKFVERFDIENTDSVVPNIMAMLGQAMGAIGGQGNAGMAGATAPIGPGAPGQAPGAASQGAIGPPGGGGIGPGAGPAAGGSGLPS